MREVRPFRRSAVACLVAIAAMAAARTTSAQEEQRSSKVPLIGNAGPNRQAFSGVVESVDSKRKLLLVNAVEGAYTEYFPIKPQFLVTTAEGKKIPIKKLEPGTNIIVYYEVRKDRRSVTNILILGTNKPEKEEESKKPASAT